MFPAIRMGIGAGGKQVIALSLAIPDLSAVDGTSPHNTTIGVRFLADGTYETFEGTDGGGSWTSRGNWIDPIALAGNSRFEVRYTNLNANAGGKNDWDVKAAIEDTWIAIDATRTWTVTDTTSNAATWDFECDFEIRDTQGEATTATDTTRITIENSG